jgi:hypothetical protein
MNDKKPASSGLFAEAAMHVEEARKIKQFSC